jgi:hypothetical protein
MKSIFAAAVAASVLALTGCASMDRQTAYTVGGAAVGGVVGVQWVAWWAVPLPARRVPSPAPSVVACWATKPASAKRTDLSLRA